MKSFTESRLKFTFDASWSVVGQWDRHDAFTRGLRNHQNTGGVDFIGLEVADKVRDTIAGLVWAMDRGLDVAELSRVLRARSPLAEAIKGRLQWLNPRVIVLSRTDRPLPGLEVAGARGGE